MKKLVMKDGNPKFILDTNDKDYYKCIHLLEKHNMYQICDIKDANDFVFCYDCYAYFDTNGKYKTKDGRSFHFDYDLYLIDRENKEITNSRNGITKMMCDGKDGIHFRLPIYNVSFEYLIDTAAVALPIMYKEKRVAIVEPEYIYPIYSYSTNSNGDKIMSLPYYTKDIKAVHELINLENKFHELFSNGKEKYERYHVSEGIETNEQVVKLIKLTKEITLEDVKNIKLCVTAYITTDKHKMNKYDTKFFSPMLNRTLYISLYPHQPKIEGLKLNDDADYIDDAGFLHMSRLFIVNLENAKIDKKIIYTYMVRKSEKLLMTKNQHMK